MSELTDMQRLASLASMCGPGHDLDGIVTQRKYHYYVICEVLRDECGCLRLAFKKDSPTSWVVHHTANVDPCDKHKNRRAKLMTIVDWNGL